MTYKKKLIEVALPLDAINRESAREKSIRHGHPSTLHLWWSRKPLATARAIIWASLVDDPSALPEMFPTEEHQERERQRLFRILEDLIKWENSNNKEVLNAAREEIMKSTAGNPPPILDPFSGGGSIPLEAQRLGLEALGGDLNPVAVLIGKSMVEIPPRFQGLPPINPETQAESGLKTWDGAQGLAEDIRFYGQWMRDKALAKIGHLYPKITLLPEDGGGEATAIAWIWARTVKSPDPSWEGHVPLVRSWVVSKKPRKPVVWVEPKVDRRSRTISYEIRHGGTPPNETVFKAQGRCIATGAPISDHYIKSEASAGHMGAHLIAIVTEGRTGRAYLSPTSHAASAAEIAAPADVPSIALSTHPQYMGPPRYGFTETSHLFSGRQATTLVTFSNLLKDVREIILTDADNAGFVGGNELRIGGADGIAYADALITYLAFAIDRLADRHSTLCSWDSGKEHARNVFGRQALPMTWNFVENNPFSDVSGSWLNMVNWISKCVERLPATTESHIQQRDAASRVLEVGSASVCTDPPYYDNVPYADISDYFYAWLRHNLRDVWPDELSTLATPKSEELVADVQRRGGKEQAKDFFEAGMLDALRSIAKIQDAAAPATIFYAFKQTETNEAGTTSTGWETFLASLLDAGLGIVRTWPVRTELANRPRAIKSGALASSIVLVCRPRRTSAPMATRAEFVAALNAELPAAMRLLQAESIAPVDLAQSAIGPGMAVFSRYRKVVEADGSPMSIRTALGLINEALEAALSEEETEFDADTRWALTWYEQYGFNPGSFGTAETLSTAKATSVAGVVRAGVATSRDGKVRLVDRRDLDDGWDPVADQRPTVWETTQHLVRRLERGEIEAAALLRKVGAGYGERARKLAYLMFAVADRKGWAKEAVVYNSLIVAWPELTRLAVSGAEPTQSVLGEDF